MKKKLIVLLLLFLTALILWQFSLSQSLKSKGFPSRRRITQLPQLSDRLERKGNVPTKSKNTLRRFSIDELINMAIAAREAGDLEESRAFLNTVLRRDSKNERATSELALSTVTITGFEGFLGYGSPIENMVENELGDPVTITITESRIEMPVFTARPLLAE